MTKQPTEMTDDVEYLRLQVQQLKERLEKRSAQLHRARIKLQFARVRLDNLKETVCYQREAILKLRAQEKEVAVI